MSSPLRFSCLLVLFLSGRALALSQTNHYRISLDACTGPAQLPAAACHEIAMAAHNTDAHEWFDLAAHAQIADGQTACAGADSALTRVRQLGGEARAQLFAQRAPGATPEQVTSAGQAALVALGRALHTVQDQCAHHGMPNPEHAWFSDSDLCQGTSLSPDLPDEAIACARAETDAAFEAFTAALVTSEVLPDALYQPDALHAAGPEFPTREGLCEFMHESGAWDGVDRGWDGDWVGPALREELRRGLLGLADATPEACALPGGTLDLKSPAARVATKKEGDVCQAVEALCVGDPTEPIVPPWEGKGAKKALSCEAGPGGLFGLAALLARAATSPSRRRRRTPPPRSG